MTTEELQQSIETLEIKIGLLENIVPDYGKTQAAVTTLIGDVTQMKEQVKIFEEAYQAMAGTLTALVNEHNALLDYIKQREPAKKNKIVMH